VPKARAAQEGSREASARNKAAVLEYLQPVMSSSGKALRIYYRADCHASKDFVADDPVPFPFTNVQPPAKDTTGIAAVREIFKNDNNVIVTEEADIIKVWIGKVPTAILETKLSQLTLDPMCQYNPMDAIAAINNTKEMAAAMRSIGVESVPSLGSLAAEPQDGLPHLSNLLKNVTVEQVLDMIAKTWAGEGLVIYGACTESSGLPGGGRPFWIEYVGHVIPK
jgi:hypothetical protein